MRKQQRHVNIYFTVLRISQKYFLVLSENESLYLIDSRYVQTAVFPFRTHTFLIAFHQCQLNSQFRYRITNAWFSPIRI